MNAGLKKHRKLVIILAVILAAAAAAAVLFRLAAANAELANAGVQTVTIQRGELVDSVSASGFVESDSVRQVNSTLAYEVKDILVEVGDIVKKGDILCVLDTTDLERDIEQTKEAIANSQNSAAISLEMRQNAYANSKYLLDNGLNTEIINTKAAVDTTKTELDLRRQTYDNDEFLYSIGELSLQDFENSKRMLDMAQLNYDKAVLTYSATTTRVNQDIKRASDDVRAAQAAYDAISSAQLDNLLVRLEDSKITAPVDGVVTIVNAKKGNAGSGLLFVVEDLNNLIIKTTVKEYDVHSLKPGQEVIVKSDGTGDREFLGEVDMIAPTAQKSAAGVTVSASDVAFDVKIKITDTSGMLKVGMNTRLNIIVERKADVLTVPFDALAADEDGNDIIFTVDNKSSDGKGIARAIHVNVGAENDFLVEVSGDGITEGLEIIEDPSNVTDGGVVVAGGK